MYLGPVINKAAYDRFEEAARSVKSQGGKFLHGGERLRGEVFDKGFFVAPTVAQLPLNHPLFGQELFPAWFLSVSASSIRLTKRCAKQNRSEFGLTGGLFSQDEAEIARFFEEAEAGVLYVNRKTGATTGAWPGIQSFCGWKGSGITGKGGLRSALSRPNSCANKAVRECCKGTYAKERLPSYRSRSAGAEGPGNHRPGQTLQLDIVY